MRFSKDKRKTLEKFKKALEKKEVDEPIIYLLKLINSLEDYYTTSSCCGRVILLHEYGARKIDTNFMVKEHDEVNIEKFFQKDLDNTFSESLKGRIWLNQEPFIIHIVAKSLKKAIEMLNLGIEAGLKHSGIFVFKEGRYILELNGTQYMSVPIFDGKMLISREYFKYLLNLANEKLKKNKQMRKKFENLVKKNYYGKSKS